MEKTLSIQLPEDVFQKLYHIANTTQRTISELIVNTVNATFVTSVPLPEPLAGELAGMHQMKDESLWNAIRPSVTSGQKQRLEALSAIAGERSLSQRELDEQADLLMAHHRSILRRAQAIATLKLRGHVVSDEFLKQTII